MSILIIINGKTQDYIANFKINKRPLNGNFQLIKKKIIRLIIDKADF